jgi:hypothetical protein
MGGICTESYVGPSEMHTAQRNLAVLFTTLWRSEIHINLKIDAEALNRRWRRFCIRSTVYHIYQGQ